MRVVVAVAAVVALALPAAGCGPRPAAQPAADPVACDPAAPTLTIVTGPLGAGCDGGAFYVDGQMLGLYPVRCAPVPAGAHVVEYRSAGDCAGNGRCDATFVAGQETVLDLRTAACR
jgi:hypothetical protein